MLIFVVARSRLDRYEELRRQFEDGRDVRIILDRREGNGGRHSQPLMDSTDAERSDGGLIPVLTRTSIRIGATGTWVGAWSRRTNECRDPC